MVNTRRLAGVRVLVTRPRDQGQGLCRAIEGLGGIVYHCPMVEITSCNLPAPGWWQGYDWLIFVSTNAVRFALAAGLRGGDRLNVAAIGKATAAALEQAGLKVACRAPPPYTSESLLAQPPLAQVMGQRILIVRGVGGRAELADTLAVRGAQVDHAELYRREPPRPDTIAHLRRLLAQGLDAVLVSSSEVLINLQGGAGDGIGKLRTLPVIVGSQRLAEEARRVGFLDVIEAASPLDEAVVEALTARFGSK